MYANAIEGKNKDDEKINKAQLQQIERLRYQASYQQQILYWWHFYEWFLAKFKPISVHGE